MKLRHGLLSVAVLGIAALAVPVAGPANAATARALGSGSGFTAMAPVRVLDTRTGLGSQQSPLGPNETRTLNLANRVPSGTTAVVFNLTAAIPGSGDIFPFTNTFVTVWPDGRARPGTSTLNIDNFTEDKANLVTVALGPDRTVDLYNHENEIDLIADLAGYYAPGTGGGYHVLTPATRVFDTRSDVGTTQGSLGANTTRTLDLTGRIPAGTTAVTLNVTATNMSNPTYITVWPDTEPLPTASNINTEGFFDVANLVTVAVSPDLKVDFYNHFGSTDVVADLAGYYTPGSGSAFTAITPQRVLDTRDGTGGPVQALRPGEVRALNLSGVAPAGATSVLMNLTGADATAQSYVTAWPDGEQQPVTSNLNVVPWDINANLASVALPSDRSVDLYNNAGDTDLVGDLAGYFAPSS